MGQYVLLQRFIGSVRDKSGRSQMVRYAPGILLDDRFYGISDLIDGGAALIEYTPDMEEPLEAFQSALNQGNDFESLVPYFIARGVVGGVSTMIKAEATGVAEGNASLDVGVNKLLIKTIMIWTTSKKWNLTAYSSSDYATEPVVLVQKRARDVQVYWDTPYEDLDGTEKFHYTFEDLKGSATHDIRVLGVELR